MKVFVLLILVIYSSVLFSQDTTNNSFILTSLFTKYSGPKVRAITGTNDNGFVYMMTFPYCALDSSFTKFNLLKDFDDKCCIERADYSGGNQRFYYFPGRSVVVKVGPDKKIKWAKSVFNKDFSYHAAVRQEDGVIKQTKDRGFIVTIHGRIAKLSFDGNIQWEIYFDRDSISGIKKTDFLKGALITDISECHDGSFIALLNASFSLLKISKEGKAMWLKSTIFKEFDPIIIKYYSTEKFIFKDSIRISDIQWFRGGNDYIETYNVYETSDGGYIANGSNELRRTEDFTIYSKERGPFNKVFLTYPMGEFKNIKEKEFRIFPEKVYFYKNYSLLDKITDEQKEKTNKEYTTIVIKTDSCANIQWTRQLGEKDCSYPMNNSNLIKLTDNNWLVRIRDIQSSAFSRFFTLDKNGTIIKERRINVFDCDPRDMTMAPDSGYYLFEDNTVTKVNSKLEIQWQRGLGGVPASRLVNTVTADSGVVCVSNEIFFKYDKFGNKPFNKPVFDSIITDYESALLCFHFNTKNVNNDIGILFIKKCKGEKIKRVYQHKAYTESSFEQAKKYSERKGIPLPDEYMNIIHTNPGIKYKYPYYKKKIYPDNFIEEWELDLDSKLQLNALSINAKDIVSPYMKYYPDKKIELNGTVTDFEIRSIMGYNQVYVYNLLKGKYRYSFKSKNGKVIFSGKFEIK